MNINIIILEHTNLNNALDAFNLTLDHLLNAPLDDCDYKRINKGIEQAITETVDRIHYLSNQAEKLIL